MTKRRKKTIAIYLLVLILLFLIVAVIPSVTDALTPTETIRYGRLKVADDVTGTIVRDETVYTASAAGTVSWLCKEGDLVRQGTKIVSLKASGKSNAASFGNRGEKEKKLSGDAKRLVDALGGAAVRDQDGTAQRRGKYSHYADGYEAYYTPKRMKKITEREAGQHADDPVDLKAGSVEKGAPLYRIADNKAWYILCWIDEGSIGRFEEGATVTVELPDGSIRAEVDSIAQEGKKWKLILRTSSYCRNWEKIRTAQMSVVTTDKSGLLISNKCITTKNGQVGVYVRSATDDYVFTPVQVLGTDGEKSLVSEDSYYNNKGKSVNTVKNYDEVLKHPDSM